MKINILLILGVTILLALLSSCESDEIIYPDFEYQTVYFATQFPLRTVELGEDLFVDNSLDNQHKVEIKATTGGVYRNRKDIVIDFKVEEALCDSLYFDNGTKIKPMPASYYQLTGDQITIPSGSLLGGVEVQLTDAFFADTNALVKNYVIPLLLTNVQGADSILQGTPVSDTPNRCIGDDWSVKPRDFVLYAVKYINPWHGNYLRRGTDYITQLDGSDTISVRHEEFVEDDEVVSITTISLTEAKLPLVLYGTNGKKIVDTELLLTFTDTTNCTITGGSEMFSVSGTGEFVSMGEKNSIGGTDRSALYLDYKVQFNIVSLAYETKDTLEVRDRGVAPEYFSVVKK